MRTPVSMVTSQSTWNSIMPIADTSETMKNKYYESNDNNLIKGRLTREKGPGLGCNEHLLRSRWNVYYLTGALCPHIFKHVYLIVTLLKFLT